MPGFYGYDNIYGTTPKSDISDKSRTVALILCLFGGLVGWHYLYVGRFWRAVICFLTLNWFLIGYIVDVYRITRYHFKDDKKLPLVRG